MPRKPKKPPERPVSPLRRLLAAIAADPTAGPFGEWARRLLAGDRPQKAKRPKDA